MATEIQDDYLICKEYQEQIHQKSATYPGFITFQHENGNHYFAWMDGDNIVLRSEAYPDAEKMERGINAILKNCDITDRYAVDSEHGAHFLVLWGGGANQKHTGKREGHSEIGRSCPHKSKEELHQLISFKGKDFADKVIGLQANTTNTGNVAAAATVAAAAATSFSSSSTAQTNTASAAGSASTATQAADSAGGGMGWLKWLIPVALIGAGLLWWQNSKTSDDTSGAATEIAANTPAEPVATEATATPSPDSNTTSATAETVPAAAATVESIKVKLIDGTELNANKGGVEDRLVSFLGDAAAKFDAADTKANWYDFDNLNFDLGKSTITAGSMVQISNLVAILKAYPALKIKVGGYTDKKGNDAGNMKLSQSRADAVIAALKAKGANGAQLTGAEGYGETLAKVDENASDEARRADRRTAVRIMAK